MSAAIQFDVDRVLSLWVRLHRKLSEYPAFGLRAYDIVVAIEKRIVAGDTLAKALLSDARISRLGRSDRRSIFQAAQEDLRRMESGQRDLLGPSIMATLEELLVDIRSSSPRSATTSFEAREQELTPRFASVDEDFISHHMDSVGRGAVLLAEALEFRGRSCWIAQKRIRRSVDWNAALLPAIENCREFFLLMNRDAAASDCVKGEVQHARRHGRRVFAIALEPKIGVEHFDIGLRARQVLSVNWLRPLFTEEDATALAEVIIRKLEQERQAIEGR